jgi:hypothetical protein
LFHPDLAQDRPSRDRLQRRIPFAAEDPKGFASRQQPLQLSNLDAFGHRALRVKFAYSFGHRANLADNLIVDLGGAGQFARSSGAKRLRQRNKRRRALGRFRRNELPSG